MADPSPPRAGLAASQLVTAQVLRADRSASGPCPIVTWQGVAELVVTAIGLLVAVGDIAAARWRTSVGWVAIAGGGLLLCIGGIESSC